MVSEPAERVCAFGTETRTTSVSTRSSRLRDMQLRLSLLVILVVAVGLETLAEPDWYKIVRLAAEADSALPQVVRQHVSVGGRTEPARRLIR